LREKYLYRMYEVSEFMKTLKQRFTMWFNRCQERRGTLWEERFKSILVEESENALIMIASYIDLNAVRAGIVSDPKDYRYGGYGDGPIVFNIDIGCHVQRGLDAVKIIESVCRWGHCRPGIVDVPALTLLSGCFLVILFKLPTDTQMPFADAGGVVTGLFQQGGDGSFVCLNQRGVVWVEKHALLKAGTPVVAPGQQRIARGSADGRRGMRIGKTHALCGNSVDVRRLSFSGRVGDIPYAHVIGKDKYDVRFLAARCAAGKQYRKQQCYDGFHFI
jgi:hypothetical protein